MSLIPRCFSALLCAICLAISTPLLAQEPEPEPISEEPVEGDQPAEGDEPTDEDEPADDEGGEAAEESTEGPAEVTPEEAQQAEEAVQPVQPESTELETAPPESEKQPEPPSEVGEPASEQPSYPEAWWHANYMIDYGLIVLGIGGFFTGHYLRPRPRPVFGAFDITDPAEFFNTDDEDRIEVIPDDPRIGQQYLPAGRGGETIPTKHLIYMVPAVGGYLAAQEAAFWIFTDDGSAMMYHDVLVGFMENVSLTLGVTEIMKAFFGRLRPDFESRELIVYCAQEEAPFPEDHPCADVTVPEGEDVEAILVDGRRSFPSGHASMGLSLYTYAALVMGGRFVWGRNATRTSRGLGIFAQTIAMGVGVFIAASRLDDGRHHPTDVFTGALIGFGMANLAYWRRFGSDGLPLPRARAKRQRMALRLTPGPGKLGLGVALSF